MIEVTGLPLQQQNNEEEKKKEVVGSSSIMLQEIQSRSLYCVLYVVTKHKL